MPKKKIRLDEALLKRDLVESLVEAQALIMSAKVIVDEQMVDKAGRLVEPESTIRIKGGCPYVSRAGLKLAGAVEDLGLNGAFENSVVLDVGASTGGFTDYCLQQRAKKVYAIDVGTNQLAWSLRQDDRVVCLENTDIRKLAVSTVGVVDWVLVDLSFISLRSVLADLARFALTDATKFILLVKPQFEVAKELLPAGGVLKDNGLRQATIDKISDLLAETGFTVLRMVDSRVKGSKGNLETFIYADFKSKK